MNRRNDQEQHVEANTDSGKRKAVNGVNGAAKPIITSGKTTLIGTGVLGEAVTGVVEGTPASAKARPPAPPRPAAPEISFSTARTQAGLGAAEVEASAAVPAPRAQPADAAAENKNENKNRTLVVARNDALPPSLGHTAPHGPSPAGSSPVSVVPTWASPPDTHTRVMLSDTAQEAAAALREIRHRLEQLRARGMWTFGITSAREGDGKTTFATQLALVLSESQRARVLLVEANFDRPAIARLLGFAVPEGTGFSRQIVRKMRGSLEPWRVVALGPALHVLAESATEPGFPETLHATHFQNAITFLAQGYDYVIVDAPSVLESGDANVVENAVDGMIVVARSGHAKGSELREVVAQLGERSTVGVALWDAAPRSKPRRR